MIAKGVKKYLINPSLGLLAGILYIILYLAMNDMAYALVVSIIFSGICDLLLRYYAKADLCGLMFVVNFCALSATLVAWFALHNHNIDNIFYIILYETLIVFVLLFTRVFKSHLNVYVGRKKQSVIQKTFLSEYFEVAQLTQYVIIFHLFFVLLYTYISQGIQTGNNLDRFIYYLFPIITMSAIIIYEELKTRNVVKYLRREEWLPIVDQSGKVTGRVAKSVSVKMKNRFMHPIVRIALVHEGKLYLQKRSADDILGSSTYDHPFEKYVLFNHEINLAVRNSISRALNIEDLPFHFLLKHVYEDDNTKRLLFLFVSHIKTEEQLNSLNLLNGKFWSIKQIEDSFNDEGVFSECFQLEFEYLKNTVLQPDLIRKDISN